MPCHISSTPAGNFAFAGDVDDAVRLINLHVLSSHRNQRLELNLQHWKHGLVFYKHKVNVEFFAQLELCQTTSPNCPLLGSTNQYIILRVCSHETH